MRLTEMKLGKSLEIHVDREGYRYRVVSKVEDVKADRVCVTLIATRSRVFRFIDTDKIDFIYKDEDRLWKWNNVKADIINLDGEDVHCFYTEKKGVIFNRRNTYRVFLGEETTIINYIPIIKQVSETEDDIDLYDEEILPAFIKDISEDGMGIFVNKKLALKDFVGIEILTDVGKVICKGEVVRDSDEKEGIYKNFYGISFTESSKNIAQYIFYLQRKLLLKKRSTRS